MIDATPREKAYLAPFFAFFLPPLLSALINHFLDGQAYWMVAHPEYWIHPAQTVLCGAVLGYYWRFYDLQRPARLPFAVGIGLVALGVWVVPQILVRSNLHLGAGACDRMLQSWAAVRTKGFDPAFFGTDGWPYFLNLSVRFLRLVVIVPLVEEIFWRGFLLRYLIRNDFLQVPIGAFEWRSCLIVALCFMGEHQPLDYPAALATGFLFNAVAYRTKSLTACVISHAVTNLLLGIYVLKTGELGFW
ncbi:MAG: prenyl protease-related protein [Chthoniobacteraceae bacterium]|nr:prenyl protease-related protein [Chthoniobacteraceae bacterium]